MLFVYAFYLLCFIVTVLAIGKSVLHSPSLLLTIVLGILAALMMVAFKIVLDRIRHEFPKGRNAAVP